MPAGAQRRTAPTAQSHTNTDTHAVFETAHSIPTATEIHALSAPASWFLLLYYYYVIIMFICLLCYILCFGPGTAGFSSQKMGLKNGPANC